MKRVTRIGGIFIRARDPKALCDWCGTHLGLDVQEWGGKTFSWVDDAGAPTAGTTVWSVGNGSNFAPSNATFMVNYRVEDLHGLLSRLRTEGCQVLNKSEESEYGTFGGVMDPEGNKVELWQPPEGD